MASVIPASLSRFKRSGSWIDDALYAVAVYAVPFLIALGTIATLYFLPRQYESRGAIPLPLRVLADEGDQLRPAEALTALSGAAPVSRYSTHLSEKPIWFTFSAPPMGGELTTAVELPSRHAQTLACWDAATLRPLGRADRDSVSGAMHPVKAGFFIQAGRLAQPETILCRGTYSGPAQIIVQAWKWQGLRSSALDFQESSGLIAGGLLTLAVFVFVTALINREWTYVIFAVWLVGNLRLCANAMGWDMQWLGRMLPPDFMMPLRQITFAAYYLLTAALFAQLFRRELRVVGYRWLLRVIQYVGVVLLAAALALPYSLFIPTLWITAAFGICVLVFFLVRLVWMARSRTVLWYVASLAIVLFATFSEVLGAAFGLKVLLGGVNTVMAALSSSMMAAFAIAEQMRAERDFRRQAQMELRNTYEVTPIGLFTLDEKGHFVRTNPALRAMLDLQKAEYKLRHWHDYFEPGAWGALQALASKGSDGELEMSGSVERGTGERRYLLKAIRSNGWIEGSLQDTTERSKAVERLRFLAEHDPLTGSLNRRGVEKAIAAQSEESLPWALAYVDLDRFKLVNDLFGHRCGDEVLRQVAARTRAHFARSYPVGRIGGDEFVCVMNDTSIEDAIAQCRELISILSDAPYQVGNRAFQVKASIGLVECSQGVRVQDALSHADRACREAKKVAHTHLVTYRKGAAAFEERAEELKLVETLGRNRLPPGLFLVMQPIMSLRAPNESLNFEVLLRMRAPDGTTLPAGKVIVAAEESGNIAAIDRWVISTLLEWIETHRHELKNTQFICVNLSGGSLNDEQFMEDIFALFARHPSVVHYLCLEITESVALHDLENTQRFIARVHEMGGKIALDDFGAGYTSFKYLKSLSADALKIDGEFVRSMCEHPADIAIVEAIVALARNLGMRSVAEWVEDIDTLRALQEIGVDYVQGFLVARPQDSSAILAARSAASFVKDPEVVSFVQCLSEPAQAVAIDFERRARAMNTH
ncbi:EAL domain-containing protein [Caballeronia sp. LZ062]|uniref:putative bifunctional diguanylate cyclase/phosphodiesterase n=1 Tax=unclassified Caballeronia TaxID=2646786 RepID=UPI00285FCCDB|nr:MULTISPECIES: EAL domain-containing protein [unclassified Caballeronia]MDR5856785.1 EAL domain-containing protein [Caballeronia sp. LZ050]MDR5869818.1 EAL domain-containing protein [Caballeronia sp. LZ062]